jgi:hypothetical protein
VFGFLYSHAGGLKLMAVIDDMTRMLSQVAAHLPAGCRSRPDCKCTCLASGAMSATAQL